MSGIFWARRTRSWWLLASALVALTGHGAGPADFQRPFMSLEPVRGEVPLLVVLLGPDDPAERPALGRDEIEANVFGPAPSRLPDEIVDSAIAKSDDRVYVWYRDGTVSSGRGEELMVHRTPEPYALPSGRTPADIVGLAIDAAGDRVHAWYRDGTKSIGNSRDLGAHAAPSAYTLPPGQSPESIVGMAMSPDGRVHAWYADGSTSVGSADDLDALAAPTRYTLADDGGPETLAGLGIARDGRVHAWTRAGTVSIGHRLALDASRAPKRYSLRRKTVQSYFEEISGGAFGFTRADVIGWLRASDDPSTPERDESSRDFIHRADEGLKGAWLIREVEKRSAFRFRDYDTRPRDGVVTEQELAVLWIYPGGGGARGRETAPKRVEVPSLSGGVELPYLVRGGESMSWATMAHELAHQTLGLPDLYPVGGTVSAGSSWDLDERRALDGFALPAGLAASDLVALAVAGSNDRVYAWYRDGRVSSGGSRQLDAHRPPKAFTTPPGLVPGDVVAAAIAKSDDRVYVWYGNGTVSSGTSTDLDLHRPPQPFSLPPGKRVSDLLAVAIARATAAGEDERVFAWYADGTVSIGSSRDLDSVRAPYAFSLPPGVVPSDLVDAGIASDDTVYAWYRYRYGGAGPFSLMSDEADGSHLDPWLKMKLGWLRPTVVDGDGWYLLGPAGRQPQALLLHDPRRGDDEYFLVENRWPVGSHEDRSVDAGIAVWHVDEGYARGYVQQGRDAGAWGRNTLTLLHSGGASPSDVPERTLWDGSEAATGYDLTPVSHPARLRWRDGSSAGTALKFIPRSGALAAVYVDVPPLGRAGLAERTMQTACTAPPVVAAGAQADVAVIALDGKGRRLRDASVTLTVGGGHFESSGGRTASGLSDTAGNFAARWQTPDRDALASDLDYRLEVRASRSGYVPTTADCRVRVVLRLP